MDARKAKHPARGTAGCHPVSRIAETHCAFPRGVVWGIQAFIRGTGGPWQHSHGTGQGSPETRTRQRLAGLYERRLL